MHQRLIAALESLRDESRAPFWIGQEFEEERIVRIDPDRTGAGAPIVIEVERDDLISLTIGEAAHFELLGKPADPDLIAEVIDWVKAVLWGGFTETIFWRDDEVARSELRIVVDGSEQKVTHYRGVRNLFPSTKLRKETRSYPSYYATDDHERE